tara:strand:- start:180 stop:590 length:411 start_codon:yes stop_codon:yes gene_type:complete
MKMKNKLFKLLFLSIVLWLGIILINACAGSKTEKNDRETIIIEDHYSGTDLQDKVFVEKGKMLFPKIDDFMDKLLRAYAPTGGLFADITVESSDELEKIKKYITDYLLSQGIERSHFEVNTIKTDSPDVVLSFSLN